MKPVMRDERGMTLPEILVAVAIILIGLVGLMQVIPVASYALQEGNQRTTATFLAEQRLEEARNAPWTTLSANDCLGLGPSAAPTVPAGASCTNGAFSLAAGAVTFADEANVAGYTSYGRNVRITDCAAGCSGISSANMRTVTVNVTYRPLTAFGVGPGNKTVSVSMLISRR